MCFLVRVGSLDVCGFLVLFILKSEDLLLNWRFARYKSLRSSLQGFFSSLTLMEGKDERFSFVEGYFFSLKLWFGRFFFLLRRSWNPSVPYKY